jgi:hypothetical protein
MPHAAAGYFPKHGGEIELGRSDGMLGGAAVVQEWRGAEASSVSVG